MGPFDWNPEKSEKLRRERGVGFEEVVYHIQGGDLLAVVEHPDPRRFGRQRILVVRIDDYVYLVPFVEDREGVFLKTIIPSRKATRRFLGPKEPDDAEA